MLRTYHNLYNKIKMENYIQQIKNKNLENEKYIKNLTQDIKNYTELATKLDSFRDKLTADIMIPIPSINSPVAFMKGTVVHTNELLVPLGSKYFAQMTVTDIVEYCNRKCGDLNEKRENILKEKKLILERLAFINYQNSNLTEIVEEYNEDEDKLWRQQHAENVKKMKIQESLERQKICDQSPDIYFSRLTELEEKELELNEL